LGELDHVGTAGVAAMRHVQFKFNGVEKFEPIKTGVPMELWKLSPMSNTLVKFAFAQLVVLASLTASFAQQAGFAPTRNVPITTLGSRGVGKCFQNSPGTVAANNRAEFVHPNGVCRAPQNITDGPGV
jgi:hypothetical protein